MMEVNGSVMIKVEEDDGSYDVFPTTETGGGRISSKQVLPTVKFEPMPGETQDNVPAAERVSGDCIARAPMTSRTAPHQNVNNNGGAHGLLVPGGFKTPKYWAIRTGRLFTRNLNCWLVPAAGLRVRKPSISPFVSRTMRYLACCCWTQARGLITAHLPEPFGGALDSVFVPSS